VENGNLADRVKFKGGFQRLMMKSAGEMVDEFIEREGGVECEKLEKMQVRWQATTVLDSAI